MGVPSRDFRPAFRHRGSNGGPPFTAEQRLLHQNYSVGDGNVRDNPRVPSPRETEPAGSPILGSLCSKSIGSFLVGIAGGGSEPLNRSLASCPTEFITSPVRLSVEPTQNGSLVNSEPFSQTGKTYLCQNLNNRLRSAREFLGSARVRSLFSGFFLRFA